MKRIAMLLYLLSGLTILSAQPPRPFVNIVISPDKKEWVYQTGEEVQYSVSATKFGMPLEEVTISYTVGPELQVPWKQGELTLKNGHTVIAGGTMNEPGFLKCEVQLTYNGRIYNDFTSVAFEPGMIQPTTSLPDDFKSFWDQEKVRLSQVPVDSRINLLPERSTDRVNVYHVSIRNINDSRIFGILSVPRAAGNFPAILYVPGAGARPYGGEIAMAEKGYITLQIGIHGVPVINDNEFYQQLLRGPVRNYWAANLDDRDNYYFKRVYLGCVRAVDFLFSLDEFDGENIAVTGGSQGGALAIITASLDKRIKYLASVYPALCDLTGYLENRAGGWPHLFRDDFTNKPEKISTSRYFDVVNFARFIEVPGFYTWGFNDNTCPPTSMYAAYNVITAPKTLFTAQDARHWTYPEQREMLEQWLSEKLKQGVSQ
jgi:cephalosporin-C deacetylase